MQEMVANEVNDRMGRAVGELKDKYDKGGKGYDAASDVQVGEGKNLRLGSHSSSRSRARTASYITCQAQRHAREGGPTNRSSLDV